MARIPAPPNPALLAQIPLETVAVDPSALVRISRHATGEPYFGYSGGGRFDGWSRALHDHPERVDGLLYMSRHINDAHAVVVFDRAAHKLGNAHSIPLMEAPGLALALQVLRMDVGV